MDRFGFSRSNPNINGNGERYRTFDVGAEGSGLDLFDFDFSSHSESRDRFKNSSTNRKYATTETFGMFDIDSLLDYEPTGGYSDVDCFASIHLPRPNSISTKPISPTNFPLSNPTTKSNNNLNDAAVIFSLQTFRATASRYILLYHVPQQLQTRDLLSLLKSHGEVENIFPGRKDDLGVVLVSFYDIQDAKSAVSKLSAVAVPVDVQFCVPLVAPSGREVMRGSNGREIEDTLNGFADVFFEDLLLLIFGGSDLETVAVAKQFGNVVRVTANGPESHLVEFSSVLSCSNCLRELRTRTNGKLGAEAVPMSQESVRLGQSLFSFINGHSKISGVTNSSNNGLNHNFNNGSYLNSNQAMNYSQIVQNGQDLGRSRNKVVTATGSHPHHQQLNYQNNHHNSHGRNSRSQSRSSDRKTQAKSEFVVTLSAVSSGMDRRTSLMIRNIPNKYSQKLFLQELDANNLQGKYDFVYLPMDFKNKCNVGYAFLNVIDYSAVVEVYNCFNNKHWTKFNSDKVCVVSYAKLQGKQSLIDRFKNSSIMKKEVEFRPLIFYAQGPLRGQPEPFPVPLE